MTSELVQIGAERAKGRRGGGDSPARLVLTLTLAGLFSGLAIVGAYEITQPMIAANQAAALRRAVFEVVPGAERLQGLIWKEDRLEAAAEGETPDLYAAYTDAGDFVGYAIPGEGAGYQDVIRLLYGYDPEGRTTTGMEVLESRETPGLGDRIYKDPDFVGAFRSLAVDPEIVLTKDGAEAANEIDGITGATISSGAVVRIINASNATWLERLPKEAPPLASSDAGREK